MHPFLDTALWITLPAVLLRELLHWALPLDAALSFPLELALALVPVAYVYERRHTPKRVSNYMVMAVALSYAALALAIEWLVFSGSGAHFWVSIAAVAPAVFVGQAVWYQLGVLEPEVEVPSKTGNQHF